MSASRAYDEQTVELRAAAPAGLPHARVESFVAKVTLTPRLSVGTAAPESIYEARFEGKIHAAHSGDNGGDCEITLPLPPQIISLADLSIAVAGKPSESVALRDGKLVWHGALPDEPTPFDVTYSAVGKGLYELAVAGGGILDQYEVSLVADGSDVRLLELSLQPTSLDRSAGTSTYHWDYERLLFGQPVRRRRAGHRPHRPAWRADLAGPDQRGRVRPAGGAGGSGLRRAAIRLVDVIVDGRHVCRLLPANVLRAGVHPAGARGGRLGGDRDCDHRRGAVTLMGFWRGVAGVVLPAAAIMAITLLAAVWNQLQGILLTSEALGFFIAAMMLMPRVNAASTRFWAVLRNPPSPPVQAQPSGGGAHA